MQPQVVNVSAIMQRRLWKSSASCFWEPVLIEDLSNLIAQFQANPSLTDPAHFRQRSAWLDRLEAVLDSFDPASPVVASVDVTLRQQVCIIRDQLEAMNRDFYRGLRAEIVQGTRPALLRRLLDEDNEPAGGLSFDDLDELVSDVLALEPPDPPPSHPPEDMVFYQPTPARHIFHLLRLTELSETDVLIDLGSGLGHVPLLASTCTGASAIGIEREEAYVAVARACAERLKLDRVTFLREDAREADLSTGTVFYLYTPFSGVVLATVLLRLKEQRRTRPIRVCTFGPCTDTVAREKWLKSSTRPDPNKITVFRSHS